MKKRKEEGETFFIFFHLSLMIWLFAELQAATNKKKKKTFLCYLEMFEYSLLNSNYTISGASAHKRFNANLFLPIQVVKIQYNN